jgi:hypothetical protein
MGGSGSHNELADTYNKMHFPRNTDYKMLTVSEVKKTLQGDLAKLLRDKLIAREYRRPSRMDSSIRYRKYGFYIISEMGYKYIKQYDICKPLEIKRYQ